MTKICVIGNSHIGALRRAKDAINATFPNVDVTFFGAPGSVFHNCVVDEYGDFKARGGNRADIERLKAINDKEHQNLNGFDVILITGHRFFSNRLLRLLKTHDILGLTLTDRPQVMSADMFGLVCDQLAENALEKTMAAFGTGRPYVFTPAPYPAASLITAEETNSRLNAHLATHPEGAGLFEFFLARVERALTGAGYGFLRQPKHTIAGPFQTKNDYNSGATNIMDDKAEDTDYTHMNQDYGLALFTEFAKYHLPAEAA